MVDREAAIKNAVDEIELLAKFHLIYGMQQSAAFESKRQRIKNLIQDARINPRSDFDPQIRNLYVRYF